MDEKLNRDAEYMTRERGAGNSDWTVRRVYRGSPYDLRGIERWLSERAEAGEEIVSWDKFCAEGEGRHCAFYLEPAAKKGEEPEETLRAQRALLGWDYVCTTGNGIFHVWRGEKTARRPAMQDCTEHYGYRKLRRVRWTSFLVPLAYLLGLAAIAGIIYLGSEMPLRTLLLLERAEVAQGLAFVLSGIFAILSEGRERKNLRTLLRAIEEREHVGFLPRNHWEKTGKVISLALLLLSLLLIFAGTGEMWEWDAVPPLPYVTAETLGGESAEEYMLCEQVTPLGGSVSTVGEGHYAGSVNGWYYHDTQLDYYAPRIKALAAPLTEELRAYFMPHAQKLSLSGFEEAYYADEGAQFLLLQRGGRVLFYRTNAPNDLREESKAFAAAFEAYEAQ